MSVIDVKVQHPADQRPLQPRAEAAQHIKTAARHLDAPFKVNDAETLGDFPVGFGREVERSNIAPRFSFDVLVLRFPDGHARVGHVGHVEQQVRNGGFGFVQLYVELTDAVIDSLHGGNLLSALGGIPGLADFLASYIALVAQRFHLRNQRTPGLVEREQVIYRLCIQKETAQSRFDSFGLFTDEFQVQHMFSLGR
jgi:hypothetical protein